MVGFRLTCFCTCTEFSSSKGWKNKKKKHDWCQEEEKRKKVNMWTCCIWQIHGITLCRAAWADESSSYPAGFHIHLRTRTSSSCLICVVHLNRHVKKYVMWKVCLVKCASFNNGFSVYLCIPTLFTLPYIPFVKTLPLWGGMFCH